MNFDFEISRVDCIYFTVFWVPAFKAYYIVSDLCRDKYSRLSLSRNRREPQKHFEISILRHIRFVVLRKKQFEQPNFPNDYVI